MSITLIPDLANMIFYAFVVVVVVAGVVAALVVFSAMFRGVMR